MGSLLDDGQWHDVEVKRNEENVSLTVDQLTMSNVSTSDFFQLDLDRKVHGLSVNVIRAVALSILSGIDQKPCVGR